MKNKKSLDKQLLVEGKDDQHVVWALCERFDIPQTFEVIDSKGIEILVEQIPVRFKQSELRAIGFIVDADVNLKARWASLANILTQQGYTLPNDIPNEGFIAQNANGVKVGVWIMPNNDLNGMLEDFIRFLVPDDDQLMEIVDNTIADVEARGLNQYSLVHRAKAKIHFWLALQETPGTPMGLAITKRFLSTDKEVCTQFTKWLTTLFTE